jgi:hypothetical protein
MAIGCKQPRVAGLHSSIFSSFNAGVRLSSYCAKLY